MHIFADKNHAHHTKSKHNYIDFAVDARFQQQKTKIYLIHNNHHKKEARISATFPCKESRACIRILLNVTISISTGLSSTSLEMSLEGINIK